MTLINTIIVLHDFNYCWCQLMAGVAKYNDAACCS